MGVGWVSDYIGAVKIILVWPLPKAARRAWRRAYIAEGISGEHLGYSETSLNAQDKYRGVVTQTTRKLPHQVSDSPQRLCHLQGPPSAPQTFSPRTDRPAGMLQATRNSRQTVSILPHPPRNLPQSLSELP